MLDVSNAASGRQFGRLSEAARSVPVDRAAAHRSTPFFFIEANARLQVEHTVTEEVMGIDLVRAQLEICAGKSLADLGLDGALTPRGFAIQARVNIEAMQPDGSVRPAGGLLTAFDLPGGAGVRVDTFVPQLSADTASNSLLARSSVPRRRTISA